jgi:mono/diheme cytochrome c family protein
MTLLAASLLALSLLPAAALKTPAIPAPGPAEPSLAAPALPPLQQTRYELFAQKCSRCHALDRALNAGFSAAEWDAYLRKKYRRAGAGAGISRQQFEEIGAFLGYWSNARPSR